jgi:hypothetical protein
VSLPLDADPLVVNAGLVLFVLDEAVLAVRLVPLVVLNMVPSNRNQLSYILFCTACANFVSNPQRIHNGQKDKEKEEGGLLCAVTCCEK